MLGKPLPGERKILPNRAVAICPHCKQELAPNIHPKEYWVTIIGVGPAIILIAGVLQNRMLFVVGTVALGLSLVLFT